MKRYDSMNDAKLQEFSHWSNYSKNPISEKATAAVKQALDETYGGSIHDLHTFWDAHLKNKSLLDIGVVEHELELAGRKGWRHKIFRDMASKTLGIDILPDEVQALNEKGYDIRICDATSDVDLSERFDVVYSGDVIEHVNDPVRLLQFAARHISDSGEIIVTTPCPFWWRNILLMARDSTFIGNTDHVRWVTPVNALEMAHRAGIRLKSHHTIETHGTTMSKRLMHRVVKAKFGRTEFFTWAYAYIFVL